MQRGPKLKSVELKKLSGSFRAADANIIEIATPPADVPVQPAYLTVEARKVWDEEFARVVACGAVEADSSLFARYCEMEASFRVQVMAGEPIKGATTTNLRQYAELLGIAGRRSRLAKAGGSEPVKASPFTVRPR